MARVGLSVVADRSRLESLIGNIQSARVERLLRRRHSQRQCVGKAQTTTCRGVGSQLETVSNFSKVSWRRAVHTAESQDSLPELDYARRRCI